MIIRLILILTLLSINTSYAITNTKTTLAEQKFTDILAKQGEVFKTLINSEQTISDSERNRLLTEVQVGYEDYLQDNPKNVTAFLLYAKFLMQTDQSELGYNAFLKINKIDPNIAVVKQQLSNYLAERGEYRLALGYILSAIELEPEIAQYHFQLGEILSTYKKLFLSDNAFTQSALDDQILKAFLKARKLTPESRFFALRHAEAYFDLFTPNWEEAKKAWIELGKSPKNSFEKEYIKLQQARIEIELSNYTEAKMILNGISEPDLNKTRDELSQLLTNLAKET